VCASLSLSVYGTIEAADAERRRRVPPAGPGAAPVEAGGGGLSYLMQCGRRGELFDTMRQGDIHVLQFKPANRVRRSAQATDILVYRLIYMFTD
jgi:hypothetical protein